MYALLGLYLHGYSALIKIIAPFWSEKINNCPQLLFKETQYIYIYIYI